MTRTALTAATLVTLVAALAAEPFTVVSSRVLILPPETDLAYRRMVPDSEDGELQRLREDRSVVFYDDRVMPPAYQDGFLGHRFVPTGANSLSGAGFADPGSATANANREFPWGWPAGTNPGDGSKSFKFFRLPRGTAIAVGASFFDRAGSPPDAAPLWTWTFPHGTVFGEVLSVTDPADPRVGYAFEVRLRTKDGKTWLPAVYRPFPTPESLTRRVRDFRPRAEPDTLAGQLLAGLEAPALTLGSRRNPQATPIVDRTALRESLPPLNPELVRVLLTQTPFSDVTGRAWREYSDQDVVAPSTDSDFHVVPRGYEGYLYPVTRKGCSSCHDTTQMHTDQIQHFAPPGQGRSWTGRIRGGDRILSFHPIDPATLAYNGVYVTPRLRPEFVAAGLVRRDP